MSGAELVVLLVTLLQVGIFSAEVISAPTLRSHRKCVGSLKSYQVEYPERNNRTFVVSRRRLRVRLPEYVILTAEGNCCWEVFRRPHFKSTSSIVTTSGGELVVEHRVRSVRQTPCHHLASVSWIPVSAGLLLVLTLVAVILGYRRLARSGPPGDTNNNMAMESQGRMELQQTNISVISDRYS